MTRQTKRLLMKKIRIEAQAKIGPIMDTLYIGFVATVSHHFFRPYLEDAVVDTLIVILIATGVRFHWSLKRSAMRKSLSNLVKIIVQEWD